MTNLPEPEDFLRQNQEPIAVDTEHISPQRSEPIVSEREISPETLPIAQKLFRLVYAYHRTPVALETIKDNAELSKYLGINIGNHEDGSGAIQALISKKIEELGREHLSQEERDLEDARNLFPIASRHTETDERIAKLGLEIAKSEAHLQIEGGRLDNRQASLRTEPHWQGTIEKAHQDQEQYARELCELESKRIELERLQHLKNVYADARRRFPDEKSWDAYFGDHLKKKIDFLGRWYLHPAAAAHFADYEKGKYRKNWFYQALGALGELAEKEVDRAENIKDTEDPKSFAREVRIFEAAIAQKSDVHLISAFDVSKVEDLAYKIFAHLYNKKNPNVPLPPLFFKHPDQDGYMVNQEAILGTQQLLKDFLRMQEKGEKEEKKEIIRHLVQALCDLSQCDESTQTYRRNNAITAARGFVHLANALMEEKTNPSAEGSDSITLQNSIRAALENLGLSQQDIEKRLDMEKTKTSVKQEALRSLFEYVYDMRGSADAVCDTLLRLLRSDFFEKDASVRSMIVVVEDVRKKWEADGRELSEEAHARNQEEIHSALESVCNEAFDTLYAFLRGQAYSDRREILHDTLGRGLSNTSYDHHRPIPS